MRLVHVGLGEIDIVGGDQRQVHRIGHLDMAAFGRLFRLGILTALAGMALQLDIEPVGKGRGKPQHQRLGLRDLPGLQEPPDGAVRAAGEADEAVGMRLELLGRDMRQSPVAAHVEAGVELHQMRIARLVLREKNDGRGRAGAVAGLHGVVIDRDLAADNRLHPRACRQNREFQRGEHVVGVGDGDGGHRHLVAKPDKLLHRHRPFEKRVLGVNAKMDESGSAGHATGLAQCGRLGKPPATGFVRSPPDDGARGRRAPQSTGARRYWQGRRGRSIRASSP